MLVYWSPTAYEWKPVKNLNGDIPSFGFVMKYFLAKCLKWFRKNFCNMTPNGQKYKKNPRNTPVYLKQIFSIWEQFPDSCGTTNF